MSTEKSVIKSVSSKSQPSSQNLPKKKKQGCGCGKKRPKK